MRNNVRLRMQNYLRELPPVCRSSGQSATKERVAVQLNLEVGGGGRGGVMFGRGLATTSHRFQEHEYYAKRRRDRFQVDHDDDGERLKSFTIIDRLPSLFNDCLSC